MKRALLLILLLGSVSAQAATVLEGYWESNVGGTRVNDDQSWDLWRPSNYFEMKLRANLSHRGELWAKLGSRWDRWNNSAPQPAFFLYEGHLKYRVEDGPKAAEAFLFTREKRFWIGNHLLELVKEDNVKDGDNAQGLRMEGWADPWYGVYVFSDFSSQDDYGTDAIEVTDDVHLLRGTRRLGDSGSYLGMSYVRKNYADVDTDFTKQYNSVISGDFLWVSPVADFSAQYAASRVPSETIGDDHWDLPDWHGGKPFAWLEAAVPRDAAIKAEMRNFQMGNHALGHYTVNLSYWRLGPDYKNYQGGDATNEVGYNLHSYYILPQRAITYTLEWGAKRRVDRYIYDSIDDGRTLLLTNDPKRWMNQNVYVEFINGFKVNLSHQRFDDTWQGVHYKHYDWLVELIVENRLAWLKTQFKIKDWDTRSEKRIYGLETTLNLTTQWKWYNRFMVASDAIEARSMLYTQIQYRPHDNLEFFLSYGPENYGDWGELVNDSDFESGGRMRDEFKLTLKTWF